MFTVVSLSVYNLNQFVMKDERIIRIRLEENEAEFAKLLEQDEDSTHMDELHGAIKALAWVLREM